jgi:hypothetical protein
MIIKNTKNDTSKFMSYLIFGASKTGKTVLSTTVPSNELLFINIENNLSSIYGADVNLVDAFSYEELLKIVDTLDAMESKPKWVFIDSLSYLSYILIQQELSAKSNDGKKVHGMVAYGEMASKIKDIIRRLKNMPFNLVCIAQQGMIKDEITGGLIFGASFEGKMLEQDLPYMFDAVVATRVVNFGDGQNTYVLQCKPCSQYQVGVRTPYGKDSNVIQGFEKPNLIELHNKILN